MTASLKYAANISDGFLFNEAGSLIERYRAAEAAGFTSVECNNPYSYDIDQLAAVIQRTGLKQALISSYPGPNVGDLGQTIQLVSETEFQDGIRKTLRYAAAMGADVIHILAGKIPAGSNREDFYPLYLRRVQWAADYARGFGKLLVIEPISAAVTDLYFLNSFDVALQLLARINRPNVKLLFDIIHFAILHPAYDPILWAQRNRDAIGHIQIAQAPSRNEPHKPGRVNYASVLTSLKKILPNVKIGLEYRPTMPTLAGLAEAQLVNAVFDYTGSGSKRS